MGEQARIYYFGCHREAGHYFWVPGMAHDWNAERVIPWKHVDGALCPGTLKDPERYWERTRAEVEGEALLHHLNGWTALSFWDRSVDKRGACNSNFFAEGTFDFEQMKALAEEHFPEVWKRFKFTVRLVDTHEVNP